MTIKTQELLTEIENLRDYLELAIDGDSISPHPCVVLHRCAATIKTLEAETLKRAEKICEAVGKPSLIADYEAHYAYQRAIDACTDAIRKEIVK